MARDPRSLISDKCCWVEILISIKGPNYLRVFHPSGQGHWGRQCPPFGTMEPPPSTLVASGDTEVPPPPPWAAPSPPHAHSATVARVGPAWGAAETCIRLEHIPVGPPTPRFSHQSWSLCFHGCKNFCLFNPRGQVFGSKKGENNDIGLLWLNLCVGEKVVNLSQLFWFVPVQRL